MKLRRIGVVCAGTLVVVTSLAVSRSDGPGGGCVPASYLAIEASGTQSLWTFSRDGTFQVASSAERAFTFSHIQGSWERDHARNVDAVGLDFGFRPQAVGAGVPPQWITRIDASLAFSRDCRQFVGDFDLRFYDAGEDPLDPAAKVVSAHDTVTGRRVEVP